MANIARYAIKAFRQETTFPTPIESPREMGSPMYRESELSTRTARPLEIRLHSLLHVREKFRVPV